MGGAPPPQVPVNQVPTAPSCVSARHTVISTVARQFRTPTALPLTYHDLWLGHVSERQQGACDMKSGPRVGLLQVVPYIKPLFRPTSPSEASRGVSAASV